ncbi:hypothetical protein G7Z17_g2768 [Cylindrodendrum hubeiense]|uniref:CENP-V/GFA domain-containing protein n=1 Tax=Cylindrodendrum hubeiense TaxID=595255 RepID=A0A9P5HC48_9HYPO|nr:hypothetical protein G7Z17_g2768 [Cylindrodendrum hubeiense]
MAASETVNLSAQCLCKAHTFTATVLRTSLPLKASCCHCDSCRHVTGALYVSHAPWLGPFEDIRRSALSRYQFTPNFSIRFCGTCSTPMFFQKHVADEEDILSVFTGALANSPVSTLIKIIDHIFVGDTIDGGASVWMRHPNEDGSVPRRWMAQRNNSDELHDSWPLIEDLPSAQHKIGPVEIPLRCRCRGVDLVLRRGDADFADMQPQQLPWFVEPKTHKFIAGFDACNSCRSTVGTDIVNWTFALLHHLDFPANNATRSETRDFPRTTTDLKAAIESEERDSRFGTLAIYESSPDVQRYFCSHCSASVFYAVDDRQELVDVAVGLLESPTGARAEDFLVWGFGSNIGGVKDTVGGWRETLVNAVQNEAEAWRIARGYPKTWRRIATEAQAAHTSST